MPRRAEVVVVDPRIGVVREVPRSRSPLLARVVRVDAAGERGDRHVRHRGQDHPLRRDRPQLADEGGVLLGEVGRSPDVVAAVLVDVVEPGGRPHDALAHDRIEGVVGAEGDDQRADAAVVAVPADGVDLGGVDAERGEHGQRRDVVVAGRLDAEQVVVAAGGRPSCGTCGRVRQGVADVPAVDPDVVVVHARRRRVRSRTALPVVLVAVEDAMQHQRHAHPLEDVDVVAELRLDATHERLDVERQTVERAAVASARRSARCRGRRRPAPATTATCGTRRRWSGRG